MGDSTLYDDDILLWSEQQAAAIRKLAVARNMPNELDFENMAEKIESVGRLELASVKSYIRLIFVHLIKLVVEKDSSSVGHWRGEIAAFHSDMMGRYSPSMWQRIDIDGIWRSALEQSALTYQGPHAEPASRLPSHSPFTLDDLLAERRDSAQLVSRLSNPQMSRKD